MAEMESGFYRSLTEPRLRQESARRHGKEPSET